MVLEQMVQKGSKDPFAWYGLAMEYRTLGRADEALSTFAKLREASPDYVPMYLMASQLLAEQGKRDEAAAWAREGLARARAKGDGHALSELESQLASLER